MKLVENWQSAYKALSVVLPFLVTTIALVISFLSNLTESGVIGVDQGLFWGYLLTGLTYLGRIVRQANLFINGEDKE